MHINIRIGGESPLLCNRFTDHAALQSQTGTSSTLVTSQRGSPREQAEPKYADTKGFPVVPGPNVFRAIVDAGKFHKAGRSFITSSRSSLVPAGISIVELECPLWVPNSKAAAKWEVDSRSVVIPSTGGRVMCHRPRFDAWEIAFTLQVDIKMFNEKLVRSLVDDAGAKIGLGDFRPARKGPFGRFKVTAWVVK